LLCNAAERDLVSLMMTEEQARRELEQRVYWDVVSRRPDSVLKLALKMLTEPAYARSVIRKHLRFGKPRPLPLLTTDRLVLEQQIFKYYQSRFEMRDVLFVGCDADTARYHDDYFSRVRFVTLEPNPDNRQFGAQEHVVATLEDLGKHCPPQSFDLILCNGVFGWGLDEPESCDAAFAQAYRVLRPGGHMLLGWNDVPRRTPVPLEDIPSLGWFKKYDFPLFGTWRHLTDTVYRHTFDFYCK
jgi:SAM-dependent methyltransferase